MTWKKADMSRIASYYMKTNFNKRHEASSLNLLIQVTSLSLVNTDSKGDQASLYR